MFSISESRTAPHFLNERFFLPYKNTFFIVQFSRTRKYSARETLVIRNDYGEVIQEIPLNDKLGIASVSIKSDLIVICATRIKRFVNNNCLCITYNIVTGKSRRIRLDSLLFTYDIDGTFYSVSKDGKKITSEKAGEPKSKIEYDYPKIDYVLCITREHNTYTSRGMSFVIIDSELKICRHYECDGKRLSVLYNVNGEPSEIKLPIIRTNNELYTRCDIWNECHHFCSEGSYYFMNEDCAISFKSGCDDVAKPIEIGECEKYNEAFGDANIISIESVHSDLLVTYIWLGVYNIETCKRTFILLERADRRVKNAYK